MTGSSNSSSWVFAGLIVVVAAWLRFRGLGEAGLWCDEAYTMLLVEGSLGEILERLRADEAPPLFYYVQKAVTSVVGRHEFGARLFPALAGLGTVALGYVVARKSDPKAALAIAGVLAFSTTAVFYAQQARSYSWLHLLTVLLIGCLLSLGSRPTMRGAIAISCTTVALLYSHNLGIWTAFAAALVCLALALRHPIYRRYVFVTFASAAVGAIPWIISTWQQLGRHEELNQWMAAWWESRHLWMAPIYTANSLTNGTAGTMGLAIPLPTLPDGWSGVEWVLWASVVLGLALSIRASAWTRSPGDAGQGTGKSQSAVLELSILAWTFTLIPIAGLLVTTIALGPAYVVGRTDTLALPGFLILLGIGWSRLPTRWAPLLVLSIWGLSGIASLYPREDARWLKGSDRDLANYLESELPAESALAVPGLARPSLEYYGRRWLERTRWFGGFPAKVDENPAAVFPMPLESVDLYRSEALELRQDWEAQGVAEAWVLAVASSPATTPPPRRPTPPPAESAQIDANAIGYPLNLLVYSLVGLEPVDVLLEYKQDWVGGDRRLLRIPRSEWIPVDSLPGVEVR